jgi:hypothetical protein
VQDAGVAPRAVHGQPAAHHLQRVPEGVCVCVWRGEGGRGTGRAWEAWGGEGYEAGPLNKWKRRETQPTPGAGDNQGNK